MSFTVALASVLTVGIHILSTLTRKARYSAVTCGSVKPLDGPVALLLWYFVGVQTYGDRQQDFTRVIF